jgi:hypothetical protein
MVAAAAKMEGSYAISAFTHPYHGGYGGPEVDQQKPGVKAVSLAEDGLSARITLSKLDQGFVYEFDLAGLRSREKEELLHRNAFYGDLANYAPDDLYDLGEEIGDSFVRQYRDPEIKRSYFQTAGLKL